MAALQTFTWSPLNGPTADIQYRNTSVQYGDGYAQVSGDGINTESQAWGVTFKGLNAEMTPILAFLRTHADSRAFKWRNPLGEVGLYRSSQLKSTQLDYARMQITATFVSAYRAEPT